MTAGADAPEDARLVIEGLGLCAAVAAAAWGLGLVAAGADPATALGVLLPSLVAFELVSVGGALGLAGGEGARRRLAALSLRPGWVDVRQGLLVGVVGLVALGVVEWAAESVLGVRVVDPAGASAGEIGSTLAFVRGHPWAAVAIVAGGGMVEEVVFRGWGVLLVRRGKPSLAAAALLVSSLLFGAAHLLTPVLGFLHYTLVGLVFGSVALASGSVLPGLVLHGGVNAFLMASLAFGA